MKFHDVIEFVDKHAVGAAKAHGYDLHVSINAANSSIDLVMKKNQKAIRKTINCVDIMIETINIENIIIDTVTNMIHELEGM